MEENKDVQLEEKVEKTAKDNNNPKQKNHKLGIWFGIAIAILACIGSFFLGHSLAKNENGSSKGNENKEEVKEETKPEEELPKEEDTVVEPEEDVFEPYSYSPNCQNSKDTYIVDVDTDKYNNIIDYIEDQENIKVTLSYCTENLNDETGVEPFISHTYTLT